MFRPCIDLHSGQVKQIVGSTLIDAAAGADAAKPAELVTNFVSERPSSWFAELYRKHNLTGGHVIMLGGGNEEAALGALAAWPGGLQVGGGITPANAKKYLDAGASHVIVTSYVFRDGALDQARLDALVAEVGVERLVLDLSCRRRPATAAEGGEAAGDDDYYVVTDRWQKFTDFKVDSATLGALSKCCSEFLVHGVDVEGKQAGLEEPLIRLLGQHSPIPVTYAGGARSLDDLARVVELGGGRVSLTIGSALDIFGGELPFAEVVKWQDSQQDLVKDVPAATKA